MGSSEERKYPPRLYAEGKSPLQNRSMVHYYSLGSFTHVRDSIGADVYNAIKETSIGLIPKLVDSNYVWSAKTVPYLLICQLCIKKNEIWSLIGGQPISFSLNEFAELTGLNTDPYPSATCEANYTDFWKELGVPEGEGPKYDEIVLALASVGHGA